MGTVDVQAKGVFSNTRQEGSIVRSKEGPQEPRSIQSRTSPTGIAATPDVLLHSGHCQRAQRELAVAFELKNPTEDL